MAAFLTPDICVIGGGFGGLRVAARARALQASVVLVEKAALGGESLNAGAMPSKALVAAGRRAHLLRTAAPFGIANDTPKINSRAVFDHIHNATESVAGRAAPEHLLALGVELVGGEGHFIDRQTLAVGDRQIRARRFVIATGSAPAIPAIPGLDTIPYFTSATIFDNPRKLTHLVVIGGGPVGFEIAQAYARLGSAVTIVEIATPLARVDPELAEIALRRVLEEGVTIHADTLVTGVQARSQGIGVTIRSNDGEVRTLDASHVLVVTGRRPSLDGLDLAKASIRQRKSSDPGLLLKPDLRTTNPLVYAIGDAAGGAQSSHAAAHQADLVVASALLGRRVRYDPSLVPSVVFTDPEIAEVGITEPVARLRRGTDYRVLRYGFSENDRARVERQSYGLVKLVTDRAGRLLGAGIVGTAAAEMISLYAFAIANHLSIQHFRNFVAPYPTLAAVAQGLADEAVRQQAEDAGMSPLRKLRRLLPLPWPSL